LPDVHITAVTKNLTGSFQGGQWQGQFLSCSNWHYTLQRSVDLQHWSDVSTATGNGSTLSMADTNSPADNAFYRIKADQP